MEPGVRGCLRRGRGDGRWAAPDEGLERRCLHRRAVTVGVDHRAQHSDELQPLRVVALPLMCCLCSSHKYYHYSTGAFVAELPTLDATFARSAAPSRCYCCYYCCCYHGQSLLVAALTPSFDVCFCYFCCYR